MLSFIQSQARLDKRYGDHGKPFRNQHLGWRYHAAQQPAFQGLTSDKLPPALSVAPFTWEYHETSLPMKFVAGFVGVRQNPDTLVLRPEIGWAVQEKS